MLDAVGVIWGWLVILWPLRLMVTSWRGFEGADDVFDADPGGVLEAAGYGQGGLIQDGVAGVDGGQNTCP